MAAERLTSPPAFETHDEIPSNGSPNRNRRGLLAGWFWCWVSEPVDRLIDGSDQGGELV